MLKDGVSAALDLILEEIANVQKGLEAENQAAVQSERLDDARALIDSVAQLIEFRKKLEQLQREWLADVDAKTRNRVQLDGSRESKRPGQLARSPNGRTGYSIPFHTKRHATGLRVTLPDGRIIHRATGAETFVAALEAIGIEQVHDLGLQLNRLPLVSTELDPTGRYASSQRRVGNYFVCTHSSTAAKRQQLEQIARRLRVAVKAVVIP